MSDLSSFPVTTKWPPKSADRIQLYSFPTPNGVKISMALEELGLPYDAHRISIMDGDQHTEEFLALSPNGKIPAIIDPDGPGGRPIGMAESGAILIYLADKTGKLIPSDPHERLECIQWVFFQMGHIGPMFGQLGFFHKFAGKEIEDKRPLERYANETKRLLGVLDKRLEGRDYVMGDDYTIADISMLGWVAAVRDFYEAGELVGFGGFKNVAAWLDRGIARPATEKGRAIPPREG